MEKYNPEILGQGMVEFKSITIANGAKITVGKITEDHPAVVGDYVHRIYSNGSNGKDTLLEFSLSREACLALIQLYFEHGIVED